MSLAPNQHALDQPSTMLSDRRKYIQAGTSLLEDAQIAFDNLNHHEISLIKETEELFKSQVLYVKQIDQLREHVPNIVKIEMDTMHLAELVDSSSALVDEVCDKFKRIDLAKMRLEDCLTKVSDILDLKTCRKGIGEALDTNNFEEAAMHIKKFLSINQHELQKTVEILYGHIRSTPRQLQIDSSQTRDIIDPKTINSAIGELTEAKAKLLEKCQDGLTQAVLNRNTRDIERFFKLFPMINEHLDGLKRYSQYLTQKISDQVLTNKMLSSDLSHVDKLSALYEHIAKLVDAHQPLIETYYGPGYLIVVVRAILKECDRLSRKVLEEFRNATQLQSVVNSVRSSSSNLISGVGLTIANQQGPSFTIGPAAPKIDPKIVDKILNDITMIISRSEVYLKFIVERIQADIELRAEDEQQKKANELELYNMIFLECELNHLVQEIGGIYVMLEQFYMNESSKKAIIIDQIDIDPASPCFISSMLDDIFFIIKKCTKRAVSTKSTEVFCAIINHCVTLLESSFCGVLDERLKNRQYYPPLTAKNLDFSQAYNAIQSGRYLQSASDQERSGAIYFSALNNLDKSCDYLKTLVKILDADVRKFKPSPMVSAQKHNSQLEKSIACLSELLQLADKFTSIVNSSLYQLFNTTLRSRVVNELKAFVDENPDIASMIGDNPKELTNLARDLLKSSDSTLEDSLMPENYARLVSITEDSLALSLRD